MAIFDSRKLWPVSAFAASIRPTDDNGYDECVRVAVHFADYIGQERTWSDLAPCDFGDASPLTRSCRFTSDEPRT